MNEEPFTPSGVTTAGAPPGTTYESGASLEEKAGQTTQSMRAEAERLKGAAREQGAAAMDQVKEGLQSATHQAQEAGKTFIRNQQETISHRLHEYAEAARAASERLHGEEGNMLAGPAQKAAQGLEQLSSYLRDKEPADLMDDLERFARRRPEIVFGGLFVAGLAAARFFKASRRDLDRRQNARAIVPTSGLRSSPPSAFESSTGTSSMATGSNATFSPSTSSVPPATGGVVSTSNPPVSTGGTETTDVTKTGTSSFPSSPGQPYPTL